MKKKQICLLLLLLLLIGLCGFGMYILDYYQAEEAAYEALESNEQVKVTITEEQIVFMPEEVKAGLVFYPGGKVQFEAYAPLMRVLAEEGVLGVLLHMPGNLAVLDVNAADGVLEEFPQVKEWYLGGHSLGGSMAAAYVSKHSSEYEGLLLLASYSTVNLADSELQGISIYGSEDWVLNREAYVENRKNLPKDTVEVVLEGGCHAYFGAYGEQDGDGMPSISREEQIRQTADVFKKELQ